MNVDLLIILLVLLYWFLRSVGVLGKKKNQTIFEDFVEKGISPTMTFGGTGTGVVDVGKPRQKQRKTIEKSTSSREDSLIGESEESETLEPPISAPAATRRKILGKEGIIILTREEFKKGIILSEILAPPRSRRSRLYGR